MRLVDVNILVYAFRDAAPNHTRYRQWFEASFASDEAYAVSDHILAGFLRVATNPRIFSPPAPLCWLALAPSASGLAGRRIIPKRLRPGTTARRTATL